MTDLTPVLRRVRELCAGLESDAELRADIERAGFPHRGWAQLAEAIRAGSADALTALLDAVEDAATATGLDSITYPTREYRPLSNGWPQFSTVSGWRCPHAHRCGRVEPATESTEPRRCAVTGEPLAWVSVEVR
jgi:hypothetical protein